MHCASECAIAIHSSTLYSHPLYTTAAAPHRELILLILYPYPHTPSSVYML